jgi:hypothetical protein
MDSDMSRMPPLDLSRATKLKDVGFRCGRSTIRWITTALESIQSKNLQQITATIHPIGAFGNPIEDAVRQEWQDLDHLLVQFWTSRSIRPKFMCERGENGFRGLAPNLLPELMRRGLVDLVERGRPTVTAAQK